MLLVRKVYLKKKLHMQKEMTNKVLWYQINNPETEKRWVSTQNIQRDPVGLLKIHTTQ